MHSFNGRKINEGVGNNGFSVTWYLNILIVEKITLTFKYTFKKNKKNNIKNAVNFIYFDRISKNINYNNIIKKCVLIVRNKSYLIL